MYIVIIYSIILRILHILHEFLQKIRGICLFFTKIWWPENDAELQMDIKKLKKRPRHLVVMLGNEEPSYKDLVNIVLWSIVAGIPIVTFYDHSGILKNTKYKLYAELDEKNIKYRTGINEKSSNGHKNGTAQCTIYINILSMWDGQSSVAEVTKNCALNNIKNIDIGIDYVDEQLRKQTGEFPDPELALYCGPICCTYGMLPWQIRLTEFVDIISHHKICLSKFKLALERYGKCEQRFGK